MSPILHSLLLLLQFPASWLSSSLLRFRFLLETDNRSPGGSYLYQTVNSLTGPPHTGVIREYNFTLRRAIQNIDGFDKEAIFVNDQFPGPLIEADYGDTISITVNNEIYDPGEGTAMHWHGILQKGTPWFDGTPGVTQCPIVPGASLTYEFVADQFGTSWYHAHYSAQYVAGIFGPMVIHGPKHVPYDIDLGPILLTDYYHRYYRDVLMEVLRPRPFPAAPPSDNNLINGNGDLRCDDSLGPSPCPDSSKLSKFRLVPGKTHRLRLINAGSEGMQRFSIDNYSLIVIANDFVPLEPYETDIITLAVGQRADVLVNVPSDASGAVWMRSVISDICSFSNHHTAHAVVYFSDEYEHRTPETSSHPVDDTDCNGEAIAIAKPLYPSPAALTPATTEIITIGNMMNATGSWIWLMNGYVAEANLNDPVLLLARNESTDYRPQWNVHDYGQNQTIRIILNNPIDFPHPMHLHGHNFKVLAEGPGTWDGTIVNPSNPLRRDTQMIRSLGYMVMEIEGDNAGVWPFHCHIGPHLSAGLSVSLMIRSADIPLLDIPSSISQTCTEWGARGRNTSDQIDSGLQVQLRE